MKYIEHTIREYLCESCEKPLGNHEGHPYVIDDSGNYCFDCALRLGLIDVDEWLRHGSFALGADHATYSAGVVTLYWKRGRGYTKREVLLKRPEVMTDAAI